MASAPSPAAAPVAAFAFMALGATGLTLGDFFIKLATGAGVSLATLLVFAWPLSVTALVIVAHTSGGIRHHLYPHNPGKLAVRVLLFLAMTVLNITSLSANPYSQHAMLLQLSPVFALAIGVTVLGERLNLHVAAVLLACLMGTWLILNPGAAGMSTTLLLPIGAAFFNAATHAYIAANNRAATALGYTFHAVNGVTMVAAAYWFLAERQIPDLTGLIWIQLSALAALSGVVLCGRAMLAAQRNVGKVAIMMYVQMPVAVILGWMVFRETPVLASILGGVIIATAGASIPFLAGRSSQKGPG